MKSSFTVFRGTAPGHLAVLRAALRSRLRLGLLVGLAMVAGAGCAYDSMKDKQDSEFYRTLYLLATLPTTNDVMNACVTAETQALNCAAAGGGTGAYLGALTSAYEVTVSGPAASNVCTQIYSAAIFQSTNPTITSGAKLCHAQCNLKYWQNRNADCASSFTTLLLGDFAKCGPLIWSVACTYAPMKSCLSDCFLTGTPVWQIP